MKMFEILVQAKATLEQKPVEQAWRELSSDVETSPVETRNFLAKDHSNAVASHLYKMLVKHMAVKL